MAFHAVDRATTSRPRDTHYAGPRGHLSSCSREKTRLGGFFRLSNLRQQAGVQNTPKSISSKITLMGTPSSQAMMGMLVSFEVLC